MKCLCGAEAAYIIKVESTLQYILKGRDEETQYYACEKCMYKLELEYDRLDVYTVDGVYLHTIRVNR